MAHKTLIGGTAYEISGGKTLIGGTAYTIKGGKTMVDGTVRNIGFGTPISTLAVGSSVFMNVNGTRTEFLVVHQGLPSADYDSSCNGTWLLMKDIYLNRVFDSADNDYANSGVHSYLNNAFMNLFESGIKSIIKQVKIPYIKGTGSSGTITNGSSGLSTKAFLLSRVEVGYGTTIKTAGALLSYFDGNHGNAANNRLGKLNGTGAYWWLRDPYPNMSNYHCDVGYTSGTAGSMTLVTEKSGVRPTLILPSDTLVDGDFDVMA